MGRLWMVQCSTAVKQMSLQMFFEYCQTSSVDYIVRESVPHGQRRDGESATADDRSCPRDDQPHSRIRRHIFWEMLTRNPIKNDIWSALVRWPEEIDETFWGSSPKTRMKPQWNTNRHCECYTERVVQRPQLSNGMQRLKAGLKKGCCQIKWRNFWDCHDPFKDQDWGISWNCLA